MPLCKSVSPEFEAVKHAWKSYMCVFVRLNGAWGGGEDGSGRIKSEFLVDKSGRRARFRITTPKTRTHKCVHIRSLSLSPARRVCVCDENGKNDSVLSRECCRGRRRYWCERHRKKQPKVTTKFPRPLSRRARAICTKEFFPTQSHFGWWWRAIYMRPIPWWFRLATTPAGSCLGIMPP